ALTGYVGGASYVIGRDEQFWRHALLALLFSGQFMAIDAVESDGSVNAAFYEDDLRRMFDAMRPFEACLGGRPVADVGVYFSAASRMSLDDNGTPLAQARAWDP